VDVSDIKGAGVTHLLVGDGALGSLGQLINSLAVLAQILLAADEDNRETLAEVQNLGNPLLRWVSLFRRSESVIG